MIRMDLSTKASIASVIVTIVGVLVFVGFEWYRRPRLRVKPADDGPDEEWIHLEVWAEKPWRWFLPRDLAVDCTARVSFLDPVTKQELIQTR